MRMCCWQFCIFVLFEAGIFSSEEISRLLSLLPNRIENLPDAFLKGPISGYREVTLDNPVQPGDILLFVRDNEKKPNHAAICVNNQTMIELAPIWTDRGFDWSVHQHNIYYTTCEKIYCIPADEAIQNIDQHLKSNANAPPNLGNPKISENEFLKEIQYSQYRDLIKMHQSNYVR